MKGYVQIYTGDGKGKTTAALGLVVRASGAGLRVYFGQFIKKGKYSEIKMLTASFPNVTVEQYGCGGFIKGKPSKEATDSARRGVEMLRDALTCEKFDVVVADEALTAVTAGVLADQDILALIDSKPESVELVLTGRGAGEAVTKRADLVTEMKCVKHYYENGVKAREGVES